ncbi:hypothetical protein [Enhygromyxa salina]|uniref:Lipoprotein n=1 Tax=Enhygromyxa salina TaxID=215803 RepID=A0A2S9YR35_9BACT|nr:hypothetical protein [Enhygromyxa salina]PRQ07564.1 hypothetical protein ENSA7_25540 [Enhygromyxa salina]
MVEHERGRVWATVVVVVLLGCGTEPIPADTGAATVENGSATGDGGPWRDGRR